MSGAAPEPGSGAPGASTAAASRATDAVVELREVEATRGERRVLAGVSLRVGASERVALVGANGSGKSTLLDVVLGLRRAGRGEVRVLGAAPPTAAVGFVPQDPGGSLLPWFRVADNVVLPLRARGASEAECARALEAVRALLDPAGDLDLRAYPEQLSGGQRQLGALLRGLVGEPRLLVCDEPFSAMDVPSRARLREALRAACEPPAGPALLLVTHDLEDMLGLVDRVAVLAGDPARVAAEIDPRVPDARARIEAALAGASPTGGEA